jgi:hypothetical protein
MQSFKKKNSICGFESPERKANVAGGLYDIKIWLESISV